MNHYFIRKILLIFVFVLGLLGNNALATELSNTNINKNKKYLILSIDGGGVRGIIPARILEEIEHRTGKPIYQLFDFVIGNSTGGLIALGLVTPNSDGMAKYTAKDLGYIIKNRSKEIFSSSIWRKIKTGGGLWGARYDRAGLDSILEEIFDKTLMSQTLKPAMIVSYSLDRGKYHLWTTRFAKLNSIHDFFLKDLAGATTAAPTYFAPKEFKNKEGKICDKAEEITCYEADGGILANNPAVLSMIEAYSAIPTLHRHDILLVSIGTGKVQLSKPIANLKDSGVIGWILQANLIDIMLNANSDITELESSILGCDTVRIQINLDNNLGVMDDASEKNINGLLESAENYIKQNSNAIDELCKNLAK